MRLIWFLRRKLIDLLEGEAPWPTGPVPPDGDDPNWPESVVFVSLDPSRPKEKEIVVRPSRAFLRKDKRLLWVVNAANGDEVTITFKPDPPIPGGLDVARPGENHLVVDDPGLNGGPFPHTTNPQPGVYKAYGPEEIVTAPAQRRGYFSYNVEWRHQGKYYKIDPAVVVFDQLRTLGPPDQVLIFVVPPQP